MNGTNKSVIPGSWLFNKITPLHNTLSQKHLQFWKNPLQGKRRGERCRRRVVYYWLEALHHCSKVDAQSSSSSKIRKCRQRAGCLHIQTVSNTVSGSNEMIGKVCLVWTLAFNLHLCVWLWCPVLQYPLCVHGGWQGKECLFQPKPFNLSSVWQTSVTEDWWLPLPPLCSTCHCGWLCVFSTMGQNYTYDGDVTLHTPCLL